SLVSAFAQLGIYGDIRELDEETINMYMKKENGSYNFSQELIDFANEKQAILQIVNQDGTVTLSSKEEHDLPNHYTYTDFIHTIDNGSQFTWVLDNGEILLYTEQTGSDFLLSELQKSDHFPILTK